MLEFLLEPSFLINIQIKVYLPVSPPGKRCFKRYFISESRCLHFSMFGRRCTRIFYSSCLEGSGEIFVGLFVTNKYSYRGLLIRFASGQMIVVPCFAEEFI